MNSKRVWLTHAAAGYGARLFGLYEDVPVLAVLLNPICSWGGYDKDTGKAKGWEFPPMEPGRLAMAMQAVKALGFEVVEATGDNAKEFWA